MCPITGDKRFDVVVAVVERASFRIGKVVVQGRGGEFDGRIYPFLRFSLMNSSSASFSFGVSEYIGQSFGVNPGFSSIAWSYTLDGGNRSDACFEKMCSNGLQYSGNFPLSCIFE